MTINPIRLHRKLYRARAIDEALSLVAEATPGVRFSRSREGEHYVVRADGPPEADLSDLLAEVADAALVITVERD